MNTKIIGILAIFLILVFGVIAFGPHARLDRSPAVCIYYYGPGSSCEVALSNCNPDGSNSYVMLDEGSCLSQPQVTAVPAAIAAQCPACAECASCPAAVAAAPTQVTYTSYLWLLIPMLFLFALLIILLLLYLETRAGYYMEKERLSTCVHGKKVCGAALYKSEHKKLRTLCPRDGAPMERTGQLRQGPKGGLRQTYVCPKCSHRTMRTITKKK